MENRLVQHALWGALQDDGANAAGGSVHLWCPAEVGSIDQDEGAVIAGQHPIRPADPARTTIVGEWEFDYDRPPGNEIRIDGLPWHKTILRADHARMDRDPRVWSVAARLVGDACRGRTPGARRTGRRARRRRCPSHGTRAPRARRCIPLPR